jgi:hypothetical protein
MSQSIAIEGSAFDMDIDGRIGQPTSPLRNNGMGSSSININNDNGGMGNEIKEGGSSSSGSLPNNLETLDEPVSVTIVCYVMCHCHFLCFLCRHRFTSI